MTMQIVEMLFMTALAGALAATWIRTKRAETKRADELMTMAGRLAAMIGDNQRPPVIAEQRSDPKPAPAHHAEHHVIPLAADVRVSYIESTKKTLEASVTQAMHGYYFRKPDMQNNALEVLVDLSEPAIMRHFEQMVEDAKEAGWAIRVRKPHTSMGTLCPVMIWPMTADERARGVNGSGQRSAAAMAAV